MLLGYPMTDTPLPLGTTCMEILTSYPNHVCGMYLEAFIQYFWTAEKIVSATPEAIRQLWKSEGILKTDGAKPANFIRNRMDNYIEQVLGDEGLRQLIAAPKRRASGLPANQEYGKSNPGGLNLNPLARQNNGNRALRTTNRAVIKPYPWFPTHSFPYPPSTSTLPAAVASGSNTAPAHGAGPETTFTQDAWERILVRSEDESTDEAENTGEWSIDATASTTNAIVQPGEDPEQYGQEDAAFEEFLKDPLNPFK